MHPDMRSNGHDTNPGKAKNMLDAMGRHVLDSGREAIEHGASSWQDKPSGSWPKGLRDTIYRKWVLSLIAKTKCSVVRVERDLAAIISLIEEMESLEPAGHPTPSRDRLTE